MNIRPEHLVERQGRQFVLYAGLLDLAHAQGLKAIRTQLLQIPSEENGQTAIVAAEVETEKGVFSGIGDANPSNVARAMLTCTIRLAETRAKARALRDATNIGVAALEELGGDADEQTAPRPVVENPTPLRTTTDAPASDAQRRAVIALARKRGVDLQRAGVDVDNLSRTQASTLIERWQGEAATSVK